jgi:hypothetical protein
MGDQATSETEFLVPSLPCPLGSRTNFGDRLSPAGAAQTPSPPNLPRLPAVYPRPSSSPVQRDKNGQAPMTRTEEQVLEVLSKSLVHIAAENPLSRRRWRPMIPPERILHTLQALFTGCGWDSDHTRHSNSRVQRGVIVLDDVGDLIAHTTWVLTNVNVRKASCPRSDRQIIWTVQARPGGDYMCYVH